MSFEVIESHCVHLLGPESGSNLSSKIENAI